MAIRVLQVIFLTGSLLYSGCQRRNTTAPPPGAYSDPAAVEFEREAKLSKAIDNTAVNSDDETDKPTVIAYYFHRTIRCVACITIEASAAQVIEDNFQEQIADGRLMWMRVNLDDEGSRVYQEQFQVSGSTLVIAKLDDGNSMQYKKLTRVWGLLSDPQALSEYVESEINEYLNR